MFTHWLREIKKRLKTNTDDDDATNALSIATYGIGQYYTVAIIGRIFESEDPSVKDILVDSIMKAASGGDADTVDKIVRELGNLVKWIAGAMPAVLGSPKTPLREYTPYQLRDILVKDNKLDEIYTARKNNVKLAFGFDPFVDNLRSILGR